MRNINAIGALGLGAIVTGAYIFQFVLHELPCPLCLLQRIGMLGAAFGLLLNVRFGLRRRIMRWPFSAPCSARQRQPGRYYCTSCRWRAGSQVSERRFSGCICTPGPCSSFFYHHYNRLPDAVLTASSATAGCCRSRASSSSYSGSSSYWPRPTCSQRSLQCGIMPCPDNPVEYRFL